MLKKIFIKNYKNTNDPDVRNSYGKVAGIFGIITNLILGIIKFVVVIAIKRILIDFKENVLTIFEINGIPK